MTGPASRGHWSSGSRPAYDFLERGARYSVAREFVDFDGDVHPVGETWEFVGCGFLPHEDGLSLFVSVSGADEWHIRMQLRPEQQDQVVTRLGDYIHPADPRRRSGTARIPGE